MLVTSCNWLSHRVLLLQLVVGNSYRQVEVAYDKCYAATIKSSKETDSYGGHDFTPAREG
jgi:hypothetical protein